MPTEVHLDNWQAFEDRLGGYLEMPRWRRDQYIFRGHARESWTLQPTIDLEAEFQEGRFRERLLLQLIGEFQQQSLGLHMALGYPSTPRQWELLGRHHGLPTSILDWTRSPYVAAFFAFSDPKITDERVAIYVFDKNYFLDFDVITAESDAIDLWDELEDFRFNERAIEQRAVFMKVHDAASTLEDTLGEHLFKYLIPSSEKKVVLAHLDEMGISARNLFRDLDSAARTAAWLVGSA